MFPNDRNPGTAGGSPRLRAPRSGLLGKLLAMVASAAALVVAFTLSLLIFAVIAAIALVALGYLWWKTRALRRQLRDHPPGGRVIDGEVIRDTTRP